MMLQVKHCCNSAVLPRRDECTGENEQVLDTSQQLLHNPTFHCFQGGLAKQNAFDATRRPWHSPPLPPSVELVALSWKNDGFGRPRGPRSSLPTPSRRKCSEAWLMLEFLRFLFCQWSYVSHHCCSNNNKIPTLWRVGWESHLTDPYIPDLCPNLHIFHPSMMPFSCSRSHGITCRSSPWANMLCLGLFPTKRCTTSSVPPPSCWCHPSLSWPALLVARNSGSLFQVTKRRVDTVKHLWIYFLDWAVSTKIVAQLYAKENFGQDEPFTLWKSLIALPPNNHRKKKTAEISES